MPSASHAWCAVWGARRRQGQAGPRCGAARGAPGRRPERRYLDSGRFAILDTSSAQRHEACAWLGEKHGSDRWSRERTVGQSLERQSLSVCAGTLFGFSMAYGEPDGRRRSEDIAGRIFKERQRTRRPPDGVEKAKKVPGQTLRLPDRRMQLGGAGCRWGVRSMF